MLRRNAEHSIAVHTTCIIKSKNYHRTPNFRVLSATDIKALSGAPGPKLLHCTRRRKKLMRRCRQTIKQLNFVDEVSKKIVGELFSNVSVNFLQNQCL